MHASFLVSPSSVDDTVARVSNVCGCANVIGLDTSSEFRPQESSLETRIAIACGARHMSDTQSTLRLRGLLEIPEPAADSSSGMAMMVTTIPTKAGGTAASSSIAMAVLNERCCTSVVTDPRRCRVRFRASRIRVEMDRVTIRLTSTDEPTERTIMAGEGMILPLPKSMFQGFTGSRVVL